MAVTPYELLALIREAAAGIGASLADYELGSAGGSRYIFNVRLVYGRLSFCAPFIVEARWPADLISRCIKRSFRAALENAMQTQAHTDTPIPPAPLKQAPWLFPRKRTAPFSMGQVRNMIDNAVARSRVRKTAL